jgi:hypothetical protein
MAERVALGKSDLAQAKVQRVKKDILFISTGFYWCLLVVLS